MAQHGTQGHPDSGGCQLPQPPANPGQPVPTPAPQPGICVVYLLLQGSHVPGADEATRRGWGPQAPGGAGDGAATGPGFVPRPGTGARLQDTGTSTCSWDQRSGSPLTFPSQRKDQRQEHPAAVTEPSHVPKAKGALQPLCQPLWLGTGRGCRHRDGGHGCAPGALCTAHDGAAIGQK